MCLYEHLTSAITPIHTPLVKCKLHMSLQIKTALEPENTMHSQRIKAFTESNFKSIHAHRYMQHLLVIAYKRNSCVYLCTALHDNRVPE